MLKLFRLSAIVLAPIVMFFGMAQTNASATTPPASAIVQSYGTNGTVRQGMIVGTDPNDATKVQPVSSKSMSNMLGVVISASAAPITLTGGTTTSQVYVATSGTYTVLVSNQNGPIRVGDYISISGLDGIGMKAENTEATALGKAVTGFTGSQNGSTTTTTLSHGGTTSRVVIGTISVNITVSSNPNQGKGTGDLPGFLAVASTSIASRPVSTPRVYLSIAVLALTVFITGSLLYSGVRNGIVSIGRNPLAKRYIFRSLLQVVLVSLIVFIIGLFAVYLLLRL